MKTNAARNPLTATRPARRAAAAGRAPRGAMSIKTILVPTDFLAPSLKAISYGSALAENFRAALHLVHVNDLGIEHPVLAPLFSLDGAIDQQLRRRLKGIAAEVECPVRSQRCHVRKGKAFDQICREARLRSADLIVISTHSHNGFKRFAIGSTAEAVVRHSPCPVLVLRGAEHGVGIAMRNILVPVDFSDCSRGALRYAIGFARRFGAKLTLLHTIYPHYYATSDVYNAADVPRLITSMQHAAVNDMRELVRTTAFAGVPFETRVTLGFPGSEIPTYAARMGADLIVTATHGRTGLQRVLIGSVAESVVRHSGCPVLVIPRRKLLAT